jgi:hypothetical protein
MVLSLRLRQQRRQLRNSQGANASCLGGDGLECLDRSEEA